MRGLISEEEPGALGVASALRQAIPAVYQEDPLFMTLCAAFDELIAPLVSAVDCFDAYLDPYLAPSDFLPWLADLVGHQDSYSAAAIGPAGDRVQSASDAERGQIASAVREHARRGTPSAVRDAVARACGVPVEQVELDDPGGTRWCATAGGADRGWPQARARIRVRATDRHADVEAIRSRARAAIEDVAAAHCAIAVDVVGPGAQDRPRPAGPQGARTYGGER
jgi:phage tail-like protein